MYRTTLKQVLALNKYYAENPPTHILVKSYLGVGTKKDAPKEQKEQTLDEFLDDLREGGFL